MFFDALYFTKSPSLAMVGPICAVAVAVLIHDTSLLLHGVKPGICGSMGICREYVRSEGEQPNSWIIYRERAPPILKLVPNQLGAYAPLAHCVRTATALRAHRDCTASFFVTILRAKFIGHFSIIFPFNVIENTSKNAPFCG